MTTPSDLGAIAASLAASFAFLLALMAAGARARRLARLPVTSDLKAPIDFLFGCWLFGMAALLLGLAGLFRGPILLGLVLALAAAGRWKRPGWRLRGLVAPLLGCSALLPLALARPFFYDALVYHLGLPWQSLQEGRIASHPEDLFSTFPPLAQLLFAAPLAAGAGRSAALLHLGSFVMAGGVLTALARCLGAPLGWARSAGALLPLLPAIVLVPGFPAAEGFAAGAIMAALALGLGRMTKAGGPGEAGARRRRVLLALAVASGFLSGVASAARLQGLAWTCILGLAIALGPAPRVRSCVAAAAGWVAGASPWWLKNLVLLGDPTAPVAWSRPGIETLWRDSAGLLYRAASSGDAAMAIVAAARPHLLYAGPLLLAALLAVLAARGRRAGAILLAALLGTAAWCLTGSLPRFWLPSLALLLALAAAATARTTTTVGRWVGGTAIAIAALLGLRATFLGLETLGGPRRLLFHDGSDALIINTPRPAFEAAAALSSEALRRDATVLFVTEARGYGFPRRSIVPSQHDVSPLRDLIETQPDAAAVRDRLRERGITHLLVNRAEMARLARDYPVLPWSTPEGQARFQDLLVLCGAPLVKEGETALFALP